MLAARCIQLLALFPGNVLAGVYARRTNGVFLVRAPSIPVARLAGERDYARRRGYIVPWGGSCPGRARLEAFTGEQARQASASVSFLRPASRPWPGNRAGSKLVGVLIRPGANGSPLEIMTLSWGADSRVGNMQFPSLWIQGGLL